MSSKIKVAFFSGPIEYSVCLANALTKYCEVDFYFSMKYAKKRDKTILNVLNPKVRKFPINEHRLRDPRNFSSYWRLFKKLKNYDIIHTQTGIIWFSLFRTFMARRVPIVYTVHDPYQHPGLDLKSNFYQTIVQKLMVMQSHAYIVHGQNMKTQLAKRYKLNKDNIVSLPHGEFSFYKTMAQNVPVFKEAKKTVNILFFGTVRKNKGLEHLIKAVPIIHEQCGNFKIYIAGKFEGDFADYDKIMKHKEYFEILDEYIPINKVANIFNESDIVALPYKAGSQSGVLALALGFAKPVVASRVGSIDEIIQDGKNGLLVPAMDEIKLAEALVRLIKDEELRLHLAKGAFHTAHTYLSWSEIAKDTVKIYTQLLKT